MLMKLENRKKVMLLMVGDSMMNTYIIKAARGRTLNCFGLLSRELVYHGETTE